MTTDQTALAPRPEVLLIDLSSLFWTSHHATAASSVSEASSLTAAAIRRAVGQLDGKLVAICCDQGRSFRKSLSPDYKANRPEKDQSAIAELERLKVKLREDGYLLLGADGFEADDVIATVATAASKAGHPVRIASADKDLLQLLALPDSSALRTFNDWATVRAADVVTKFGVEPEALRDWLALVGDSSDNIKGCPGVGPKRATELLIAHFDLDSLYRKVDALPFGDTTSPAAKAIAIPAVVGNLAANKAAVMLARDLVTLKTDAPVDWKQIYERREPLDRTADVKFEDDAQQEEPTSPKEEAAAAPPVPASANAGEGSASVAMATAVPNGSETKALAVTTIAVYERQLEPKSANDAIALGKVMYESRAFTRFPTPQSLGICIIAGREIGLGAVASTNAFHFMAELGCLALKAHTIIQRAMDNPKCKYLRLTHTDEFYAEYEGWHVDHPEPYRHRFTIQDAVDRGLCGLVAQPRTAPLGRGNKDDRSQWDKGRKAMLRKSCGVQIVTILWPGSAQGFPAVEDFSNGEEG